MTKEKILESFGKNIQICKKFQTPNESEMRINAGIHFRRSQLL